jgi:hypothetical protein
LFGFWDGNKTRYVDPFKTHRALWNHDDLPDVAEMAGLFDTAQEPEASLYISAVADVFGVKRWDAETETGLSDYEIVRIMNSMYEWLDDQKKSGDGSATQSDATDGESSESPAPKSDTTESLGC